MQYYSRFPTKNDVLCLFFWIWIKSHLQLKDPSIYFCQVVIQFKSRGTAIKVTENKGVSSTNSLAFENYASNKLLIYIKNNNNGRSLEPLITRALTSDQLETCPFNKTLCFLFLRRSHKRFSKLLDIPFCIVYILYTYT